MASYEELEARARARRFEKEVAKVDEEYIRRFSSSAGNYLDSAQKQYEGMNYGNAYQSHLNRRDSYNDLDYRRRVIQEWSKRNPGKLDQQASTFLDSFGKDSKSILDAFSGARDYYVQRKAEEEYLRRKEKQKQVQDTYDRLMNPGLSEQELQRAGMNAAQKTELSDAKRAEQDAKRKFEEYARSEEGRRESREAQKLQEQLAFSSGGSITLPMGATAQGEKWNEYKAIADYFELNRKSTEDRHTMERDVLDVEAMSAEDRKLLETYAYGRNEWMDHKKIGDSITARAELEKKYGKERVKELAESWVRYNNLVSSQNNQAQTAQEAGSGLLPGVVHNAASVVANTIGTLSAPLGYLQEALGRTGRYQTLDPNNVGAMPGQYASAVRQGTAQAIEGEDPNAARKLLSLGYQGAMSAADNGARILLSMGTGMNPLGLAALGSFGSTLSEASANGATPGQAVLLGVANAGLEAATEKLSLDELFRAGKGGYQGAKAAFKQALKQAGIEATEEEISFLGSLAAEAVILRENSGYNRQIGELVANGMSYADAKNQADRQLWDEAVNTAIQSAASGGIMSGAQSAGQRIGQWVQERNATRNATVPENATVPVGAESATTEKPTAEEYIDAMAADLAGKSDTTAQEQPKQITDQQIREAMAETIGIDTAAAGRYNQNINTENTFGGTNYGAENDRTAGAGDPAQGVAGVQRGDGHEVSGRGEHGGVAQRSGILRVSEDLQRARSKRGLQSYDLYDTSTSAQEYEQALIAGRNSDTVNGWCVTPKSVQELAEGNVRTAMNADGTVGVGVAPDGDIVAVFKNKNGGPRKALDTAMPAAIEMGGDRLDCYGEGLVTVYEGYGFIPVARVEFNPEYANDGWTPEKGTPYIYVMMHNGDNAATVTDKMHSYKISTKAELDALPTYGKDGYDDAMAYRDSLFQKRQNTTVRGQNVPQGAGEGFEAMGAADYNFSPYTRMQNEYGNIPEGENPVRPDDAPISTDGTDRVSYTARTAIGAEVTPDEFVPLIENEVVRGGFSFIPITNDQTVQNAVQNIQAEGWRTARANWTAQVRQGRTGADITATGALLYNHAVNSGDYQEAMDILLDYQQAVRNAAQAVQAARILKRLTPENRLYMIRRSIQRMVEDMNLDREITVDEDLARRYQETRDDAEADRILDEIARDVARQIPPTLGERITALRYLNMLGNFRTQVRNIAGNLGAKFTYLAKDELAATIEGIASGLSGGRIQRTKVNWVDRTTRRAARADYENVADWISGGGRANDRGTESDDFARRVQENRRILPAGLEQYRRATNWAMNNEYFGDAAFGREAYARALAGYLNARGIRTDNLNAVDRDTLNQAREYAVRQAQEATFRDNNQVSTFVSRALRGRDTPAWARVIGEAVMPFRKTPANVLVRAEEFSPLGLINSAVNTVRAARGDISGAELVESWAKTLTGTGLFAIGWALSNMGYLRGGPDEDEEKAAFDELNGYQDYALVLPDGTNLTIDFLSPAAMPVLLGAQLDKVLKDEDMSWADLEGVFSTLADPMIEMSMLQGVNDTIDAIRYADNSMGQFLINAMTNYLTQALGNTLMGQVERSTEESRMTTYVDKESNVPAWLQRNLGKLSQKVPGWDYQQTEYIDQWGREQRNPEGIKNWLYQLLSPSYIDRGNVDAVANELYRLNEAQTGTNVFPQSPETQISYTDTSGKKIEKYNLSLEELDKLKRTEGQTQAKLVADLIGIQDYSALSDAQKAKAVSLCYDYARELARGQVLPGYDGMESWMEGIQGREAGAIIQEVAGSELKKALNGISQSWKDGQAITQEARMGFTDAVNAYDRMSAATQKAVAENASGALERYIEAKEKGVGAADFLNLYEASVKTGSYRNFDLVTEGKMDVSTANDIVWMLEGITGTGKLNAETGKHNIRDIDRVQAIADGKGLTDKETETAIRLLILDDKQEEKLDNVLDLGYGIDEYADFYQAKVDNSKKADFIAALRGMGLSSEAAIALYNAFR